MEELEHSSSYYSVLGVSSDSSDDEIRRAYRKLAMQWHPDKWTRSPSLLGKAKRKFQQIQEAYSVLSDRSKRLMYDTGFYDPHEEEDEGFADFLQEMMSLMDNVKKEGKTYSMAELQSMFQDMAKSFEETREWSSYTHDFSYNSSQSYHPQSFAFGNTSSGSMNWRNGGQSSSYTHDFSFNSSQCYHPQSFAFSNTSYGSMNWHNRGQSSANFVRRSDELY